MRLTKKYKKDYYANPDNEICKLDIENDSHISQAIRNKLGKLEDLEEILMNGYTDKKGSFHREVYITYIDDDWCLCDMNTDEYFLLNEVLI